MKYDASTIKTTGYWILSLGIFGFVTYHVRFLFYSWPLDTHRDEHHRNDAARSYQHMDWRMFAETGGQAGGACAHSVQLAASSE